MEILPLVYLALGQASARIISTDKIIVTETYLDPGDILMLYNVRNRSSQSVEQWWTKFASDWRIWKSVNLHWNE